MRGLTSSSRAARSLQRCDGDLPRSLGIALRGISHFRAEFRSQVPLALDDQPNGRVLAELRR